MQFLLNLALGRGQGTRVEGSFQQRVSGYLHSGEACSVKCVCTVDTAEVTGTILYTTCLLFEETGEMYMHTDAFTQILGTN